MLTPEVTVKFIVKGREVSPDQFGDEIQAAVLEHIKERIVGIVSDVRCPEHNETATSIEGVGESPETLEWKIYGCCDKLTAAIQDAFKGDEEEDENAE
jgi:hypothetical protein